MGWKQIRKPLFQWGKTVDRIIWSAQPQSLSGEAAIIATDSSGLDAKSRYRVDAYLCVDLDGLHKWEHLRCQIRQKFLPDGRRISYKGLNDKTRARALIPFLSSVLDIPGLLLVTVTNRSLRTLCFDGDMLAHAKERGIISGKWKEKELDTAVRIAHTVAYIVGGMSQLGARYQLWSERPFLVR
jgi:hypothetical protein